MKLPTSITLRDGRVEELVFDDAALAEIDGVYGSRDEAIDMLARAAIGQADVEVIRVFVWNGLGHCGLSDGELEQLIPEACDLGASSPVALSLGLALGHGRPGLVIQIYERMARALRSDPARRDEARYLEQQATQLRSELRAMQ